MVRVFDSPLFPHYIKAFPEIGWGVCLKIFTGTIKSISYSALNEVLNGKRALNHELAMMMEAALDVDAAPLLAMQNEYDMLMAERNESFMEKLKHIRRIAAVF